MTKVEIYRSEPEVKEARFLTVCAKTADRFSGTLEDEEGNEVYGYDGYVPSDLGIGGGDYVEFKLDLTNGTIVGWKPIKSITIEES